MAIAAKPKQPQSVAAKPDPLTFIQGADHGQPGTDPASAPDPAAAPSAPRRKEPVIVRFDDDQLAALDKAAAHQHVSRAAMVRLVLSRHLAEYMPD